MQSLINKAKSIISPKIKLRIKRVINQTLYENELEKTGLAQSDELEKIRLQNFPRFTETEVFLLEKKVRIVDIASFQFIKKEIFDQEIYKFKSENDTPYILDCGANIGLSIIYFKQLFPNAEIVGFEPDDKVFKALKYNIEIFNFKNVELVKKACWNKETVLKFYSEGADSGRRAQNFDTVNIIEVETVTLKKYLSRKVDLLKIDIEGAENEVLENIRALLVNVERIFVEFHSFVGMEQMLPEILKILKEAGFRLNIHHIGVHSFKPFIFVENYNNMDLQLNIFGYRLLKT